MNSQANLWLVAFGFLSFILLMINGRARPDRMGFDLTHLRYDYGGIRIDVMAVHLGLLIGAVSQLTRNPVAAEGCLLLSLLWGLSITLHYWTEGPVPANESFLQDMLAIIGVLSLCAVARFIPRSSGWSRRIDEYLDGNEPEWK